jgi:predicted nucleic acid-binding Zn ribbon protein
MITTVDMPTYEYQCECGKVFEYEQRISEPALTTCPFCRDGGECPYCGRRDTPCKVERLVNGGNFILKGGGWYKDGYSSAQGSSAKTETKTTDNKASESQSVESKKAEKCSTTCGCD